MVNKTIGKLNAEIQAKLRQWGKIVQLVIDENEYFIDFNSENFALVDGFNEDYDFKLSSSSTIFFQIINNVLNPVEAVVSGEVAIEGSLTDALEFSELISRD